MTSVLPGQKIFLMAVMAAVIGLMFTPSPVPAITLDDLLSSVEEQYEKTRDFQADFVQETFVKSMGKTEREVGRLYYKKPRKMLWLYEKPKAKTLVVNAEKSWLYLPEDQVVYVRKTDQLLQSTAAVRLLSGLSGIRNDFHVQFLKSDQINEKGNYLLQLMPRDNKAGFIRAHIDIESTNFNITQVWFEDAYGNTTRVKLSGIRLNQELPDRKFLFVPPDGVEIFSLP